MLLLHVLEHDGTGNQGLQNGGGNNRVHHESVYGVEVEKTRSRKEMVRDEEEPVVFMGCVRDVDRGGVCAGNDVLYQ